METQLLGETHMQNLLNDYIQEHKWTSVNWLSWRKSFEKYVNANWAKDDAKQLMAKMNWMEWVYGTGLSPKSSGLTLNTIPQLEAKNISDGYIELKGEASPTNYQAFTNWDSNMQVIFCLDLKEELLNNATISNQTKLAILTHIDADLNITGTKDPEVKNIWYPMGLLMNYESVKEPAHLFISSMGRLKYLTPVYQALLDSNQRALALQWYSENIDFYHP